LREIHLLSAEDNWRLVKKPIGLMCVSVSVTVFITYNKNKNY